MKWKWDEEKDCLIELPTGPKIAKDTSSMVNVEDDDKVVRPKLYTGQYL